MVCIAFWPGNSLNRERGEPNGSASRLGVPMNKTRKSSRPRMRSWEADEQVAELLDLAVRTTGASLRDIVNEALREHAPGIIRRLLDERGHAEAQLRDLLDRRYPLHQGDHRAASDVFADKKASANKR